ncbi:MAG: hypothetical protein WA957_03140 [Alteraurantiacibacter sp.]
MGSEIAFVIMAFIFAMLLVCLIFGTIAGKRDRVHKIQKLEIEARIAEAGAMQAQGENRSQQDVEERLRVLERIVTDPTSDLSRQIEDLREDRQSRQEIVS